MVHSLPRSHGSGSRLDHEPDLLRSVTCPMCHVDGSLTHSTLDAGGAWRCVRCGQHWDAVRLTAVAAYVGWASDRERARRSPAERVDGTP